MVLFGYCDIIDPYYQYAFVMMFFVLELRAYYIRNYPIAMIRYLIGSFTFTNIDLMH